MRGVFDEKDFDPGRQRRDTELTLSSTTLLGIFFGMVLLCGLFFGLGFAVGRYGPSDSPAANSQPAPGAQPSQTASSKSKPPATPQIAPDAQRSMVNVPVEAAATAPVSAQPGANSAYNPQGQQQVRPALPAAQYQPAAPPAPAAPKAQPSSGPASGPMVQVAAVMHPEDAEVLVGALRRRGYPVSVRRLPTDNLIHVQIGPFKSRDEAYRWRQQLLNDGYNAMVMP
jgi:cell division septation protein DedD